MKTNTLEELLDKYIGKKGSEERMRFEFDLELDILGSRIRQAKLEQHLTQEELDKRVGCKKRRFQKLKQMLKMFGFQR